MKIILSHDVDHLYSKEHLFRDLFFPKLMVRSFFEFINGKITLKEFRLRLFLFCNKSINHIMDLLYYDRQYKIPSCFFFGMDNGLGMSYRPNDAKSMIEKVKAENFNVGLHGINYDNFEKLKTEYLTFQNITGTYPAGIRMHYVRRNERTLLYESKMGFVYDSSDFNKIERYSVKAPYKVNQMWEFPIALMDSYLPDTLEAAKDFTMQCLNKCYDANVEYVTVLFHDFHYTEAYSVLKEWYEWFVEYVSVSKTCSFISFEDAIIELERKNADNSICQQCI